MGRPLVPQEKARTKSRDLQREGDILRRRISHYQHRFDHVEKDASLPQPVTGTAIADSNAEEVRQSKCFTAWRGTINMHSLRSDFWVMALAAVAEQESTTAARRAEANMRAN